MTLDVQDLTRRFGRETALDGVSFRADAGERIAVVGRNGAGKTTLLRILTGEERPDEGTVTMEGNPGVCAGRLAVSYGDYRSVTYDIVMSLCVR